MKLIVVDLEYIEPDEVIEIDFFEPVLYSCRMSGQLNIDLDLYGCEVNYEIPYFWLGEALRAGHGFKTTIEVRELDMELQLHLDLEDIYTLIN